MIVELVGENNIHKIKVYPYKEKVNKCIVGGEAHGIPYNKADIDIDYEIDAYLIYNDKERAIDINQIKGYDSEIEKIYEDIEYEILDDLEYI